jgi:hypothetical protein
MGQMAPAAPLGRTRAIEGVEANSLPIWFGSPHPHAMILEQDGRFRIRQLVVDEAEARASSEAARAANQSWMPEHYYGLGKPTGTIYADAGSREELVTVMRTMAWPANW